MPEPYNIGVEKKEIRKWDRRPKGMAAKEKLIPLVKDADTLRKKENRATINSLRNRRLLRDGKKQISDIVLPLASVIRHLPGGKERFIEFARLVGENDPRFKALVQKWDSVSVKERQGIPLEELARRHDISPGEFLGRVTQIAYEHGSDLSNYIAAVYQPKVVEKTVEMALTDEGVKDREMLYKHSGFIPTPQQGTNVLIQNKLQAGKEDTLGLPPMEEDVVAIGPVSRSAVEGEIVEEGE